MDRFFDRADAGRQLAEKLAQLTDLERPVIVGLPRGGVPVAFAVATTLNAPLDVIVVRKIGVPYHPELAMGAIGEGDVVVLDEDVIAMTSITSEEFALVAARERIELQRRVDRFRPGRPAVSFEGRTVIIVDDGIATGSTARAACRVARARGATRVVLAVPVAAKQSLDALRAEADQIECVVIAESLSSVGQWYQVFDQTSDGEVVSLLARAAQRTHPTRHTAHGSELMARDDEVTIPIGTTQFFGQLTLPREATGVVLFAHGSGSSRHSPRNRMVAELLNEHGLGTLLFDLLTVDEERERANVFDVELLSRRLLGATHWLESELGPEFVLGYFGASTGAAAALMAAAEPGSRVAAVVSRGGRVDLARSYLTRVRAATLMIVGGADLDGLALNREAALLLACEHRIEVVPGATHLFEEPGTLEQVASLSAAWFLTHFVTSLRAA